jgi:hypothetical protein
MQPKLLLTLGLALSGLAFGGTITFTDPFPGTACGNPATCDVVGDANLFDIQKVVANINGPGSTSTFNIFTNYNNGATGLGAFTIAGSTLNIGDLLITVNGSIKYGIALTAHDSLAAGSLYQVASTYTSNDKMEPTANGYRQNVDVWIKTISGSALSAGSVNVSPGGAGNAQLNIQLSFLTPTGFFNDLSNTWGIQFSSATCANDVITGSTTGTEPLNPVPESGTLAMLGAGLIALHYLRLRTA